MSDDALGCAPIAGKDCELGLCDVLKLEWKGGVTSRVLFFRRAYEQTHYVCMDFIRT